MDERTVPRPALCAEVILVRPLTAHAEFAAAVDLQRQIWGFDEIELLPVRLFVTALKVGGQALGAYDGRRMIGFCLAIPGIHAKGKSYLHSHMLGVVAEYRNLGVGRKLKLAQRKEALARGIDLVEWTFDPLELKNAWFNLEGLGAIVRRFVPNQYGSTTSPLHAGLPTDRCVAEWWLSSSRVSQILAGGASAIRVRAGRDRISARIAVPAAIGSLKRDEPRQARDIQTRVREEFQRHLTDGLAVVGFERQPDCGVYLLGHLLKPWEFE
jgi:predicted GNAT superfamily acetyltransferase